MVVVVVVVLVIMVVVMVVVRGRRSWSSVVVVVAVTVVVVRSSKLACIYTYNYIHMELYLIISFFWRGDASGFREVDLMASLVLWWP